MAGTPRRPKTPGELRKLVARRIEAAIASKYSAHSNKNRQLAKDADVSLSTVQRVLAAESGPSIDTLETLAEALDLPVVDMVRNEGGENAYVLHPSAYDPTLLDLIDLWPSTSPAVRSIVQVAIEAARKEIADQHIANRRRGKLGVLNDKPEER